jgi:hypothetical protein
MGSIEQRDLEAALKHFANDVDQETEPDAAIPLKNGRT